MKTPTHTLYYGPMKSGKSKRLIEYAGRCVDNNLTYLAFKPKVDHRNGSFISSRAFKHKIPAKQVSNSHHLINHVQEYLDGDKIVNYVFIDEIMLLDSNILFVLEYLKENNIHLVASGLIRDFKNDPFILVSTDAVDDSKISMLDVMEEFDMVIEFLAKCDVCGEDAEYSQRLINGVPAPQSAPQVSIEGDSEYQARCKSCYII